MLEVVTGNTDFVVGVFNFHSVDEISDRRPEFFNGIVHDIKHI